MPQTLLRTVLGFFSKRFSFGQGVAVRLLLVTGVLVLASPSRNAEAGRDVFVSANENRLPPPSVRYEKSGELVDSQVSSSAPAQPVALATPGETQGSHVDSKVFAQVTPTPSATAPADELILKIVSVACTPWQTCEQKPSIEIQSIGHLNKSKIVKIQVQVGDQGKVFSGDSAALHLPRTSEQGEWLRYWAFSENGEQSPINTIKYVNYKTSSDQEEYYFAILGPDWANAAPGGSVLWEMFPPIGAAFPAVLEQPLTADYLYTTNRYGALAGHLISSGVVDARSCSDGAINATGYATPCGEVQAAKAVLEWQNRYNTQIYDASLRYHVPARILKAMIAQETQFWPAQKSPYEIGLGSITENGVEMLLNWNQDYFQPLCSAAYGKKMCSGGYFYLGEGYRAVLRRIVWEKVSTPAEIDVLAAMLFASAAQVNQMIKNTMYTSPGDVSSYEEMWKITVANYHSGSGCMGTGLIESAQNSEKLTLKAVGDHLLGDCKQALSYVDNVWRYAGAQP